MLAGGLECDIMGLNRWEIDRWMDRCKSFLFFSTKRNSIYILYGGFIQTVFAPFGQMINGLIK